MTDELSRFLSELLQDIHATQLTDEEGGATEQIFTGIATELLTDAGETENVRIAYDEGQLGTRNQHKINGYGEPDNYETLDLFVTIFRDNNEIATIPKEEIDKACKRVANFYRKARTRNYANDIEEASEVWEFANTIASHEPLHENLVRINAIILTNGLYGGRVPPPEHINGCPLSFRVVDLTYLYNLTTKSHVPIEIDFDEEGCEVSCIPASSKSDLYESYLAIVPGRTLANIYERYGARLLEQNVRSFLQFTGKVNKGIRKTILDEPEMFFAFNNGIAATADSVELVQTENGTRIKRVQDLQIVNGGQTTASIYHTAKKDRANVDKILVQVKLSIIKSKPRYNEIVSQIAEYSNTQNKVAFSELSSNIPFHVAIEKLSRTIVTPYGEDSKAQTKWFYERARGQYKNARIREGWTAAKRKKFDMTTPRNQVFSKGDLAKYINVSTEIVKNKKVVVGPHIVVRGSEKNYVEFIKYNLIDEPDNVYYEDLIARAIIYKTADKLYGVKPNALGDLKYVTVPYSIAWIFSTLEGKVDLLKIWKNQTLSASFRALLLKLMPKVERYIKALAPGSLYAEFAKREDCWRQVKEQDFIPQIREHLANEIVHYPQTRRRLDKTEIESLLINAEMARIRAVGDPTWAKIVEWGRASGQLSQQEITIALHMPKVIRRRDGFIDPTTREAAVRILNKVVENAPSLLDTPEPSKEQKIKAAVRNLLKVHAKKRVFVPADEAFLREISAQQKLSLDDRGTERLMQLIRTAEKKGLLD